MTLSSATTHEMTKETQTQPVMLQQLQTTGDVKLCDSSLLTLKSME